MFSDSHPDPHAARACPPGFPPAFLWGAATSAYQIEGSPLAEGAGASIWHRFSHTLGTIANGETGDLACDHYRRFPDDVRLMRELGLRAYRFSVSWGRLLPEGRGPVNRKGLAFYERLVDMLLDHGIAPVVTLYHWDLPVALDERGGWANRDVAHWFADYACLLYRSLGDRVLLWITLNEPWVVMHGGYIGGTLAPGYRDLALGARVSQNLLLAHGQAVRAYRAEGRHAIGIAVNLEPKIPASGSRADREAAVRADAYMNRHFLDPIFRGEHPAEIREMFGAAWPQFSDEDIALARSPIDFLGVNYYTRGLTRHDPAVKGIVDDPLRVAYLCDHLRAARTALARGVDLRGYFAWSLLDNFEWAEGYSKRFGLVFVDYETQARIPKQSARFYTEVIDTQGACLSDR
ncbi:MAG: family 1 glycosylhydrolase [Beggiatoa sp.]|nr:family 1 glycosylhydrolase [Beggiatoa sp.]